MKIKPLSILQEKLKNRIDFLRLRFPSPFFAAIRQAELQEENWFIRGHSLDSVERSFKLI